MRGRLSVAIGAALAVAVSAGVAVAASTPTVTTESASGVGQSSAVLHGLVNPNGSATSYQFQWGLTPTYGLQSAVNSAGHGTRSVSVNASAKDLIPGTIYHYRLLATNAAGQAVGADRTFKTAGHPPASVATGPGTELGTSFATMTGTVNPNGEATTWFFQWGTTTSYGSSTFGGTLPASGAPQNVTSPVTGLASGTIFHFRLVAMHGSVTSYGSDEIFMTFPNPRPVPGLGANTFPHTARHRPFVFTTAGAIVDPRSIPSFLGCAGQVGISYFLGGRLVAFDLVAVQPDCAFAGQVSFAHLVGRRKQRHAPQTLRVRIFYRGTGYLAPRRARTEHVVLG